MAATAVPARADDLTCDYDVTLVDPGAVKLDISVACDPAVKVTQFTALGNRDHWWTDPEGYRDGNGRFTYDLGAFAKSEDNMGSAMVFGDAALVTPGFLLALPETEHAVMLRFRLKFPAGGAVLTALQPDKDGYYRVPLLRLNEAGPLILGNVTAEEIVGDPELTLAIQPDGSLIAREQLIAWVSAVAEGNRRFWARSPARKGLIILVPTPRGGVPFGRVLSLGGAVVTVLVGRRATPQDLYDDWVLVHEMLHLGSPLMRDTGAWLNEGIATFYEPVLRARAGWKSEDDVWHEWISQMPRGIPAVTGAGLANAGRGGIYWGGALFVLMAEIESLQASGGKIGFSDCLRAVLAEGGDVTVKWPTMKLLDRCDALLGGNVIAALAKQHIERGSAMDLDQLWRRLGVSVADGAIRYDDAAELAWLRPLIIWGGTARPAPISASGFLPDG
ncbi:gluzincin family metallopeptidase [Dongia deserti]|uniref:hypothetical protein n=1 Tax=Dongia deserti TaxID=2268030 RepID=UPI000E6521EB|nr:hypothetical protein [Dongia deserti]